MGLPLLLLSACSAQNCHCNCVITVVAVLNELARDLLLWQAPRIYTCLAGCWAVGCELEARHAFVGNFELSQARGTLKIDSGSQTAST